MIKKGLLKCRYDWGIVLALAIGLIAAWPFLANPGLPSGTDAELHIFRIAEIGESLRAGNLYPRWAPNFYHGYGYPIFNYYAPLTYHLGNWVTLLIPQTAVLGAKILFVAASLLGALGAYFLGRLFGERSGGLVGAATFAYAPYVLLVNPHIRGDLAEVFALSLVPWALWSWERLWTAGGKGAFCLAVITPGATILSHNLTGLTVMVLLALLSAWHWLVGKRASRFWWALSAGILVMTVTAFFWLPFLLERHYIQLNVAGEGHYDFRNHFVLLRDLLSPLLPMDWRAATLQPPMTANPLILGFALVGEITALVKKRNIHQTLFYFFGALLCLWLVTPASRFVWENIPGLEYYQFPWRFLGPLAALLVPLTASTGTLILPGKPTGTLAACALGIILISTLPALYPIPWPADFGDVDSVALLNHELQGRWRGTTSTDDFVPVTVTVIPGPQETLLKSYRTPPVDRVNRFMVPDDATVEVLPDKPWRNRFAVNTPSDILLRLYIFDFPGWKAYIDGEKTSTGIANPEGFITVWVPTGKHEVLLSFEDTLPRKIAWIVAGAGGMLFLIALVRFPVRKMPPDVYVNDHRILTWMAVILGCFAAAKGMIFDPLELFHYTSPEGEARAATHRQTADFGGEIALLGYDLSRSRLKPAQAVDVAVYWNALRPMTKTYQSFVHLVYPEGEIWVQSDHLNPAGFPTNLWPTDRYIRDIHRLVLPQNIPPGDYALSIGIYRLEDDTRLPVLSADSGGRPENVILNTTIMVRRSR